MKVFLFVISSALIACATAQFRPSGNGRFNNNNQFGSGQQFVQGNQGNRFASQGRAINNNNFRPAQQQPFRATPSNARDTLGNEVYPGCNGTVCLPEANLCSTRKERVGHYSFNGKSYWASWVSNEPALRNARWNWFTGRNYCRKMCMDMISLESQAEQNFAADLMRASGIKDIPTSGRLCDAEVEGCDKQPRFQPLKINGWFWSATLQMMPPTNSPSNGRVFNNWSPTGPAGQPQPDGELKSDGFGKEACMALLDNKYGDGVRWHDEPCNNRRVVLCEDLPLPNINFVRNQNPGVKIP
ncbi:uncharacterized protein [Lepeophtheirus salmonis]|uniref:uncharacterized protein n=1 Tax=Lepeophtheirus salmonis TaxID=72036 RepID=UPI001AE145D5|nr:uncharacterized protein LOC121120269 [Lepeophtheirus salmonis]